MGAFPSSAKPFSFLALPLHRGHGCRTHFGGLAGMAAGALGLSAEPMPESTTDLMEGQAPVPAKPQLPLSPPPGHPLFMQPPAVRAALWASVAKKKMYEAKMHSDIARKEADKAEDEWRKSVSYATEAAARRDACIRYQLHASMVRSLNRLVGFSARSMDMVADGRDALGSKPPELAAVGNMAFEAHKQLDLVKEQVNHLRRVHRKLAETEGFDQIAAGVAKPMRLLLQQQDRVQEIVDDLDQSEAILLAQVPESHEPPVIPKRLLRPDGEPWWPERPPKPEGGGDRLMLVKAYNPTGGFPSLPNSAGAKFL